MKENIENKFYKARLKEKFRKQTKQKNNYWIYNNIFNH